METFTIAMQPSMMERIKKCAVKEDVSARLIIREAIDVYVTFIERKRDAKPDTKDAEAQQVSA
jgi:predicted transcriptional regulator